MIPLNSPDSLNRHREQSHKLQDGLGIPVIRDMCMSGRAACLLIARYKYVCTNPTLYYTVVGVWSSLFLVLVDACAIRNSFVYSPNKFVLGKLAIRC